MISAFLSIVSVSCLSFYIYNIYKDNPDYLFSSYCWGYGSPLKKIYFIICGMVFLAIVYSGIKPYFYWAADIQTYNSYGDVQVLSESLSGMFALFGGFILIETIINSAEASRSLWREKIRSRCFREILDHIDDKTYLNKLITKYTKVIKSIENDGRVVPTTDFSIVVKGEHPKSEEIILYYNLIEVTKKFLEKP